MKLELDIPEWVEDCNIRVMAGTELIAYRLQGQNILRVKKVRCIGCGDCCKGLSKRFAFPISDEGTCVYLKWENSRYVCTAEPAPYGCFMGKQEKGRYGNTHCVVEYEEREIK